MGELNISYSSFGLKVSSCCPITHSIKTFLSLAMYCRFAGFGRANVTS